MNTSKKSAVSEVNNSANADRRGATLVFRARVSVLPRWAGALLIVGAALAPVSALVVPPEYQPKVMVPNGLALAWLGYALFSERRESASELMSAHPSAGPEPSKVA